MGGMFGELGGAEGLRVAVSRFYDKVLADPEVAPFFDGVDRPRLEAHQLAFLAAALGGPELYDGRPLDAAHHGRGIDDEHFDRVVAHLTDTLTELGADAVLVGSVRDRIRKFRRSVVG